MLSLNTKHGYLILSIASGILLSIPWYDFGSGIVLFFAILPLLYIEDSLKEEQGKTRARICLYSGITFFIWGLSSGWWLANATIAGTFFLVIATTLFYTVIVLLFHLVKKRFDQVAGYFSLVSFWVAFEYWYLNAEFSVPWLNLANGLSHNIKSVQWFEYTGSLGGTAWILILNILLYELIKVLMSKRSGALLIATYLIFLLAPVIFSQIRFRTYKESGKKINVLAIQPNIDPYEKFISFTPQQQVDTLLKLSLPYLDEDLDYLITPETCVTAYSDIDRLESNPHLYRFRQLLNDYPDLNVIIGMTLLKTYDVNESISGTAQMSRDGYYFDTYNSAVQINRCSIQYYHKSKLFPGVETMPYANSLKFLKKLMLRLGGTYRSHGISPERINLASCNDSVIVAPVICWENVYGEFVSDFIKKGAMVIFNITNEGWWGNTPGHKMFKKYAQIRAIENRRSVVRSANTGISAIINQKGEIIDQLTWDQKGAIKGSVYLNNSQTFYTKYGDYTGDVFKILSISFLLALVIQFFIVKIRTIDLK